MHRCLEHVAAQTYSPIEVVVVDNGSSDGSLDKIKTQYPNYIYIENDRNLGYASGMNQGIRASRGEFVLPLNQDVCLERNYVAYSVSRMKSDARIGAMGGRVLSWIGDQLTDELRKGEGERAFLLKRFKVSAGNRSESETWTFCPSGSFPFLRSEMLKDLLNATGSYYDEAFETGWEDTDMFLRMHLRGWKALFTPHTFGWHVGSGSVGGNATFLTKKLDYQLRVIRNRYFTIMKNLPLPVLLWLAPYLVASEIGLVPYFILRSPKSLIALAKAQWQVVMNLSSILKKRRSIQRGRTVSTVYVKQLFGGA